jgi:hypothetical protein
MGRLAPVVEFDAAEGEIRADAGEGEAVTASHFEDAGSDSHPLPTDEVHLADADGAGLEHAVGYTDTVNPRKSGPGEKRIYARNADTGEQVCEIWLKADGAVVVENDQGFIELGADGDITLNGVVIDKDGNILAPGEVTAMAAMPAASVSLSTHIHGTPSGASSPPTAGT